MTQMTKSTLLHINAGDAGTAGFAEAKNKAHELLSGLQDNVWSQLNAGGIWTGVGQPDAESVVHANVLTLTAAEALMDAGAATITSAAQGFNALQATTQDLERYAEQYGLEIFEDGYVYFAYGMATSVEQHNAAADRMQNLQEVVKQTLKTATALDLSTAASLRVVSDGAQLGTGIDTAAEASAALPGLRESVVDAIEARRQILEVAASWLPLDGTLLGVADLDAAAAQGVGIAPSLHLDKLLQSLEDGIGVTKAGPLLNVIKGDISAVYADLVLSQVALAPKAAAAADAAGKKVLSRLLGAPLRAVAGWGVLALDVGTEIAAQIAGRLAPTGEPTQFPVTTQDGTVKAQLSDRELADIANGYYFTDGYGGGTGHHDVTVSDLARAQRVGAAPWNTDFVENASGIRGSLQDWVDEHGTDDPNYGYAKAMLDDLDSALGD